ncbi:MAG: zinc-dependent metalloprotease [Halobacteriales archaeon]|nr:zinc-dependent metalloprotease [Halobacteriales archaeon]
MTLLESLRSVATASGDGAIDWAAAARAAKASTDAGSLGVDAEERTGYARDVRDARDGIRAATGLEFDLPGAIEVQSRHHWIDANVATFSELLAPLEGRETALPGVARRANTATMAGLLAFTARHVLGQYDPLLLAEDEAPGLYFVRPNVLRTADELGVHAPRFRRWIAFHEVTHAAEFGAAPWLAGELEGRAAEAVETLADGRFDRSQIRELDAVMTAVEGYAEFAMDRAFDGAYADVRRKVDDRRRNRGPVASLLARLLGLEGKRRQYERGKAFFEAVAAEGGEERPALVWADPVHLPTPGEIEAPERWLDRVVR